MPFTPPLYIRTSRDVWPTPFLADPLVGLIARLYGDGRWSPLLEQNMVQSLTPADNPGRTIRSRQSGAPAAIGLPLVTGLES